MKEFESILFGLIMGIIIGLVLGWGFDFEKIEDLEDEILKQAIENRDLTRQLDDLELALIIYSNSFATIQRDVMICNRIPIAVSETETEFLINIRCLGEN